MDVSFYALDTVDDSLLEYAVIVSNYDNKWIYCKHRERDTWEIPGGHRESNEPENLTYPNIQPKLFAKVQESGVTS